MIDSTSTLLDELDGLIARVALSDRPAFDQLYTMTSSRLFAVAMRIMKNRAEAEDVLQDAYVRIWQRAGSYRPGEGRSMSWLIAITRNLAIDRMRIRTAPVAPIEMAQDVPDDGPTPETALVHRQNRAKIDACLEELEAQRAEAVRAAYLEGWSYQELADRFDTPLNTIRTWLRRSLMRLRDCLEQAPR
ncbi:sigma-70 family RNA polymerase sigma factor [uncultured Tateyamaria sp.]|uniref:sigma-70 family RNA polymerase sigma factor n=1 Tax=uncultured Tateyamaria sp. TaxID=455651 RepID=UPI002618C3E7|nr:sigma-70 family RNA polymerase sigma factor [uncultured Tateyamaria sp.]